MTRIAPVLRHFGGTATAAQTTGGVDIDLSTQKNSIVKAYFIGGDTIQVRGNVESDIDLTGATVTVTIETLAGVTQATLLSTTTDLTADTAKTLAAINGDVILTWPGTRGDWQAKVTVSHANVQDADQTCPFVVRGYTVSSTADPFTQAYEKLWNYLEAWEGFTDRVHLLNRTKLSGSELDPYKRAVQAGDLPEALLRPAGGLVNFFRTSSGHAVTQNYQLAIISGEEMLDDAVFPIKWEVIQALSEAEDNLGLNYIERVRMNDFEEVEVDPSETGGSRGKRGWIGLLNISIDFKFTRAWALN